MNCTDYLNEAKDDSNLTNIYSLSLPVMRSVRGMVKEAVKVL